MRINTFYSRRVISILVVAMSLQAPLAQAEIVSTDQMTTQSALEQDRAKIQNFIERANVKERLLALGVSGVLAEERVAALSEQEVHALAQKIDSLPAGGALGTYDWIVILLIVVLIAIIV